MPSPLRFGLKSKNTSQQEPKTDNDQTSGLGSFIPYTMPVYPGALRMCRHPSRIIRTHCGSNHASGREKLSRDCWFILEVRRVQSSFVNGQQAS
jgi:hypothetical protein